MTFNVMGARTLFVKEVRRFMKVWLQTVLSPLITTSLYFLVFGVALGSTLGSVDGIPYIEFVIPGLVMLSIINAAFLNTSSSLFQSKINGTVVDILVAPLGASEILTAYVAAAVLRAAIGGALVYVVACLFSGFSMAHPVWVILFAVGVSIAFALLGLLSAVWADKFDQLSIVPNFVLTPLTFLGGVFYSVDALPEPWSTVSRFNPILYTVNGLRYGILGVADITVHWSALFVLVLNIVLAAVSVFVIRQGYKLRR